VICHPKLVETGLDLLAFPTLYFYETAYSLHTLRQASRRSWRIGQRFPVRVKFVTYSGTMQDLPSFDGQKDAGRADDGGQVLGEGLQALDTDEDLMSAMARELVEKSGVGESADAVWRDLGHEREKVLPRPAAVEPEPKRTSPRRRPAGPDHRRTCSDAIRHAPDRTESAFKEAKKTAIWRPPLKPCAAQPLRLRRHVSTREVTS